MNFYKVAAENQPALRSTYSSGGRLTASGKSDTPPLFYRQPYVTRASVMKTVLPEQDSPINASQVPEQLYGVGINTARPLFDLSPTIADLYNYSPFFNRVNARQDADGNVSRLGLYHELAHAYDPSLRAIGSPNLEREIPPMVVEMASYLKRRGDTIGERMAVDQQAAGTDTPPWVYAHMLKYGPKVTNNNIKQDAGEIRQWMGRLRNPSDPLGSAYRTWAANPAVGPKFQVP